MNKNIITPPTTGGVYSTKFYKGGQAGLIASCLPRLPRGGLRRSDESQRLSDCGEVTP